MDGGEEGMETVARMISIFFIMALEKGELMAYSKEDLKLEDQFAKLEKLRI